MPNDAIYQIRGIPLYCEGEADENEEVIVQDHLTLDEAEAWLEYYNGLQGYVSYRIV